MTFSIFVASQNWAHTSQISCHSQPTVKSTNDWAKENAFRSGAAEFEVYIADQQTAGRGRGQNTWTSPAPGTALLSTWSFQMASPPPAANCASNVYEPAPPPTRTAVSLDTPAGTTNGAASPASVNTSWQIVGEISVAPIRHDGAAWAGSDAAPTRPKATIELETAARLKAECAM